MEKLNNNLVMHEIIGIILHKMQIKCKFMFFSETNSSGRGYSNQYNLLAYLMLDTELCNVIEADIDPLIRII